MEPSQPQGPPRRISPYPSGQPRVTQQLPSLSFPRIHLLLYLLFGRFTRFTLQGALKPLTYCHGQPSGIYFPPHSACRPNGECTAAPLPQHWHGTSRKSRKAPTSLYPQGTAQYWQGTARYRHRPTHPTELYLYCTTGKRDAPPYN